MGMAKDYTPDAPESLGPVAKKNLLSDLRGHGVCGTDYRATCAVKQPKRNLAMKATKLLIAAAAFAGLASLSLAGPGPEYWARMNAAGKKPAAYPSIWQKKSAETKAKPAAEAPAACATGGCCACTKKV